MILMNGKKKCNKNIILITIDSLRADHLHCMGYPKSITPTIDRLAKNGLLFTNAISNAPYTPYSIPSFISSNLPPLHGKIRHTIAQVLKNYGYKTAAFNPNTIIFSDTYEGCDISNGFDIYDLMLDYNKRCMLTLSFLRMELMKYFRLKFNEDNLIYKIVYNFYNKIIKIFPEIFSPKDYNYVPNAESINNRAIDWIKNQKNRFFLWLHYMDVHQPYAPIDYKNKKELFYLISKYRDFPNMLNEEEVKKLINLYDLEIKYVDKAINKFLTKLKEENHLENTIIIISADHGEAFDEHGALGHGGQFRVQLYDEYIKVPLVIWGLEKRGVIDRQVQLLDLAPTICDLINIPIHPNFFGKSYFKISSEGTIITSEFDIAYRTKNYKLIIKKSNKEKNELYDLKNDPHERNNIYNNHKIMKKLRYNLLSLIKKYKNKDKLIKINVNNKIKYPNNKFYYSTNIFFK